MKKSEWNSTPGSYDSLHTGLLFNADSDLGIPVVKREELENFPEFLVPYGTEVRRSLASARGGCCHFFLDDYRFESLWNKPVKTLEPIKRQKLTLSPDFSLYTNYPLALQIYNVYRNRYLARYWQENGVVVIPTVAWSDERSYAFAFCGLKNCDMLAISTVGVNNSKNSVKLFIEGVRHMLQLRHVGKLTFTRLIVYGSIPKELIDVLTKEGVEYREYKDYWANKNSKSKQQ